MSDHEFDEYLGLLGRMLRLARSQREGIARELRDHLEDRLEELTAQGVPREEAIGKALEEFGDAAVLAAEFIQISRNKRRRWIMRCTMGVGAAVVVGLIVALSYWPTEQTGAPIGRAVADSGADDPFGGGPAKPKPSVRPASADPFGSPDKPKGDVSKPAAKTPSPKTKEKAKPASAPGSMEAKIHAALDAPTQLEFIETPLQDFVDYLKDFHGIEIQFDTKALKAVGVGTDAAITRNVKGVSLCSALDLVLRDLNLSYTIRHGVLLITTHEESAANLTRVIYPVKELVAPPGKPDEADFDSLIDLITTVVEPAGWDEAGGPGSIAPFENRGALVVAQNAQVHEEIATLLKVLRQLRSMKAEWQQAGKPKEELEAELRHAGAAEQGWPVEHQTAPIMKIGTALDSPTQLEFIETPLQDVVDYLKDFHGIEIQLDKKAMEKVGVGTDSPVTKNLKGVTLRQALGLVLRDLDLAFTITDEVLLITTPKVADQQLRLVLYPVDDLVLPPGETDLAKADFDALVETITTTVAPDKWAATGGPGAIGVYRGDLLLAVLQTSHVQHEIGELLAGLRKLPAVKTVAPAEKKTP